MKDKVLFCEKNISSTQDFVTDYLKNHPEEPNFVWCLAESQSAGRGRQQRTWLNSEKSGDAFLASMGLYLPRIDFSLPLVSLLAGLVLYEALEKLGLWTSELFVKWPNDLYSRPGRGPFKKIGGILSESPQKNLLVIGWGLNLRGPQALDSAGTLADLHPGLTLNPREFYESLSLQCSHTFGALLESPQLTLERSLADLKQRAMKGFFEAEIAVRFDQSERGIARDLAEDGALIVQTSRGFQKIYSGEILLT